VADLTIPICRLCGHSQDEHDDSGHGRCCHVTEFPLLGLEPEECFCPGFEETEMAIEDKGQGI
jgi:hypothetical protein